VIARVLLALALTLAAPGVQAGTCREQLDATLKAIPALEAKDFDAATAPGWRALSAGECHAEAAQALGAYIAAHGHVYHLAFHQGQMLLYAGENAKARPLLLSALRPELPASAPFKWDAYVLATVAWIDGDRERFLRERAVLEAAREFAPNAMNLRVLDALGDSFGGSYLRVMQEMKK
jgi:hypothetical protein